MTGVAIDVLVPTCNRPAALAVTLATLGAQTWAPLRIVVSDQSEPGSALDAPEVLAVLRYLQARGHMVETWRHLPRRGMAEQRAFLLAQVRAPHCLFLDDDVILEPDLVARLRHTLLEHDCGFVGSALHGLSYRGQRRPEQEYIEFWDGPVAPETVLPDSAAWERHHLHSACNLFHLQERLALHGAADCHARPYRVAWIGGCVLFDTARLRAAGGFEFWPELPPEHCGEDVLAQLRVMARFGGCGIIPSGAYHMELPTTVTTRQVNAPMVLVVDEAGVRPGAGAARGGVVSTVPAAVPAAPSGADRACRVATAPSIGGPPGATGPPASGLASGVAASGPAESSGEGASLRSGAAPGSTASATAIPRRRRERGG